MKTKSLFTWFAASAMLVGLAGCQQPEPEAVLSSLKITEPTKMNYKVGEQFNKAGLVVEAVYSNNYKKQVSDNEYTLDPADDYTFTAADFDAGEKEFTVTYTDKEVTKTGKFTVQVIDSDPVQTGITANVKEGTTYFVGDNFDPSTIEVFKVYDKTLNPERMESGYTLSLDSTYVFTEADQAGKTLTVTAGEFTFPVQLSVVERTWTQKVEKWLLDTYELEPYSRDASGQIVGDYDLSPLWMVLDDYTDNPISFPIEEKEDEDGKYLKLHVETSDDSLINEIFSAYVGLAMLPHYFEEYYLDLALPVWNAEDLFSMYISGDFVIYTMPNENGDYVVFESHLSSTQTTVTSDIYIYTEKAYSAAQASALIEQTLSSETYGIAEPGFATSAEALAEVSDWFYLLPIEDGFTLAAPFYSGAGEDLEIRSALEEAVNATKWEVDNQFYEFAGGFARSEAKNEKGLQAVANYYQPNDTFETFFKNLPEFTAYYNLFNIDFYLDTPQVTFKKFLEDTNAELVKAGFTDTVIPSISVQGIEGKTESDEKEFDVGFMSYENLAEESYQDKYAKAFPTDKWTVKVGESYLTVTSKEVANDKLVRIYVQSDIENHRFNFEVTFIDNVKAWPVEEIATFVADNEIEVEIPSLTGSDWFVKEYDEGGFYIHKDMEKEAGVALLDSYIALFNKEEWNVVDYCEYEKDENEQPTTVRKTYEYEIKSIAVSAEDEDAYINVYVRYEDGELKISVGLAYIGHAFPDYELAYALASQGWDISNYSSIDKILGHYFAADGDYHIAYHIASEYDEESNTYFVYSQFAGHFVLDDNGTSAEANYIAYFIAKALGLQSYSYSEIGYAGDGYILVDGENMNIYIDIEAIDGVVTMSALIAPNPDSFNAAELNAALASVDSPVEFPSMLNAALSSGVQHAIAAENGTVEAMYQFTVPVEDVENYYKLLVSALNASGFNTYYDADGEVVFFAENTLAYLSVSTEKAAIRDGEETGGETGGESGGESEEAKTATILLYIVANQVEVEHQLPGSWTGKMGVQNQTITFNANGKGEWNGNEFDYTYNQETNKVTFQCAGFDFELTYDQAKQTLVGTYTDGENEFDAKFDISGYQAPANYVGKWVGVIAQGQETSIELYASGFGVWGDYLFTYTVDTETGAIEFEAGGYLFTCEYDSANDKLIVSAEGDESSVEDAIFARPAIPYLGAWYGKVGLNNVVINFLDKNNVSVNGDNVKYDVRGNVLEFTIGNVRYLCEYNSEAESLAVTAYDTVEEAEYEGVLGRTEPTPVDPGDEPGDDPVATKSLVGTWNGVGYNNQKVTLVFNSDGTGSWGENNFDYTYNEETGAVSFQAGAFEFSLVYNQENQSLTGTYGDDETYDFACDASGYVAPAEEPEQKSYVGSWSGYLFYEGNSVSIVLNADGTGSFGGTAFEYTVEEGVIIFTCGDIEFACTYDAENDRLLVSAADSELNEVEDKPFTRAA